MSLLRTFLRRIQAVSRVRNNRTLYWEVQRARTKANHYRVSIQATLLGIPTVVDLVRAAGMARIYNINARLFNRFRPIGSRPLSEVDLGDIEPELRYTDLETVLQRFLDK